MKDLIPDPPDLFVLTSEPGTYPPSFSFNLGDTITVGDTLVFQASPNEDFSPPTPMTRVVLHETEREYKHGFQGKLSSGQWFFRLCIEAPAGASAWSEVLTDVMPPLASVEARLMAQLAELRLLVEQAPTTPANVGHNGPPEPVGLPPYHDEDTAALLQAIGEVTDAIEQRQLTLEGLSRAAEPMKSTGERITVWLGAKSNLLTDEVIKNGVKWAGPALLIFYGNLAAKLHYVSDLLTELCKHL